MARHSRCYDGFWLPADLRPMVQQANWETRQVEAGRIVPSGRGVTVRWPKFTEGQWASLRRHLRANRGPVSPDLIPRWQTALSAVPDILARQTDTMAAIACYTGYPESMMMMAFAQGNLLQMGVLGQAIQQDSPTWQAVQRWQPMAGGLPGAIRFYPAKMLDRTTASLRRARPLFRKTSPAEFALGFAAGNVPGNGLLIAFMLHIANHTAVGRHLRTLPPAVLVRNSRQAPLLAPWVLSAIETLDPGLVRGVAMLTWDPEDAALQRVLVGEADLMMAAAGDAAIASLDTYLDEAARPIRFHRHGHKVSFAAIGRSALDTEPGPLARLAALDSTLWNQFGCLSPRVHFVEQGGGHSPLEYAKSLATSLRDLTGDFPRGGAPRRYLHRSFDLYKLLEADGPVQVLTTYEDDCLVVVDERPWNAQLWRSTVNRCTGRVVVVRPVADLKEVPTQYISALPAANLQSLSVAVSSERILELAHAVGRCGVTAIRGLGRAAFPQLAYSWDGLLPLDLGNTRPPGHFTTVETLDPLGSVAATASELGL